MKKLNLLLSIFIGLAIISCSSDNNDNPQSTTSQLVKMEQRTFENNVLQERIIFNFSNQKPLDYVFYNNQNQITYTTRWNYDSSGKAISIKGFLPNGTLNTETIFSYDAQNRIIKTVSSEENNTYITTTTFTHNGNNTITSNRNSNGYVSSKTFEVNNNGLIDKEIVNGNVIISLVFDNQKLVSKTAYGTTYTYTYLSNGLLPLSFQDVFGGNLINSVLYQNSLDDASGSLSNDLTDEITSSSSIQKFVYTLTTDNFPLTKKDYYDGELRAEFDYFYE